MERVSVPFSVRPDLERSEAPLRAGDPDDLVRRLKRAEFDGPLRSDLLGERPGCEEGVSLLAGALEIYSARIDFVGIAVGVTVMLLFCEGSSASKGRVICISTS